ncbi:phosphoenolpyruvate-dependent sugar phosphotransferase system, EIIA 2 [Leptospira interrogans serovar Grippotyphosa str. LT2186]|uniref:Phosphoenolpyruvate-dependent sugar phosphotransferase system, EIIA 2 n=14 Tax=Leptospira interrogans TaxID=173 RepID=M3H808_LEPIR|nr:phosphoenolpyruvate-dependent sugar phosphotransferase system, EIIA 2 [Leptospira interrogans serovar Bataviae str. L1111]EMG08850.1 phosphoenolpyruvate-dependent sugar phosphotransferase system, EIIA 2 [Leptospira interrogans serovar Grippotyphosa str. LT2186]EMN28017.1 phosphoenolpyruvate-dependent sugar phosphotransferase system, EIIA 2 [Leptospira interrogans serovar Pyrogenes str. L0374]EMN74069.1 phosphoenolpyruvate-dependent sugar PTS family porter, EIIA 2 [Leptospira interrogans serov
MDMNQLLTLLQPETVIFNLESGSKEEVISRLLQKAIDTHQIDTENKEEILESLLAREKSMSTGIGSGVAIPHCSVNLVDELKCVMGLNPNGIDFDSIDHQPVHIFILLIVPKTKFQEHIKTLAQIAKALNVKEDREKLIRSGSFEEIQKAFSRNV